MPIIKKFLRKSSRYTLLDVFFFFKSSSLLAYLAILYSRLNFLSTEHLKLSPSRADTDSTTALMAAPSTLKLSALAVSFVIVCRITKQA